MNLYPYFDAVDFENYSKESTVNWKYSLGSTIEKQTLKLREGRLKNVEMAIVGVPFQSKNKECQIDLTPDKIRKDVYGLVNVGKLNIIDFGNLKPASSYKGNYLALRDVIDYLTELDIVAIVLGGSQDYSYGICQAFRNNPFFSFCSVDAYLDVKKGVETLGPDNYLSRVFKNQPNVFQFGLLGYQSHYVPQEYFGKTKGLGTHIRLGVLRNDLVQAEPVFRNSDFLSFDFCALKNSEAPSHAMLPNGLYGEEACQLSKLAGMSNRLKVFGLFGVDTEIENAQLSLNLSAQVIWYFIDGYLKRDKRKPGQNDGFSVNRVEIPELSFPLVFYKNEDTEQWWIQVKDVNKELKYFACSEKDYLEATQNEIPEVWLKYVQKIDEILK